MVSAPHIPAQDIVESYKFDLGAGIGMSGYLGDANESNLLKHPGFAANIGGRYLFDSRWAVRAQLSMLTLSGNTADFSNVLPDGKQLPSRVRNRRDLQAPAALDPVPVRRHRHDNVVHA